MHPLLLAPPPFRLATVCRILLVLCVSDFLFCLQPEESPCLYRGQVSPPTPRYPPLPKGKWINLGSLAHRLRPPGDQAGGVAGSQAPRRRLSILFPTHTLITLTFAICHYLK